MGGTKRHRQEMEMEMKTEMNTDTLANILTMALEAKQLELKKKEKGIQALRKELEERNQSIFMRTEVDEILDRSYARLYKLVVECQEI